MKISEIMSREVHVTGPDVDAQTAWRCMQQLHVRHLIVVEGERVIGLISERDLGGRHGDPLRETRAVRELMTPEPITLDPEADVRTVSDLVRGLSIGSFPVVSNGQLVGIVTTSDLLDLIGKLLARG